MAKALIADGKKLTTGRKKIYNLVSLVSYFEKSILVIETFSSCYHLKGRSKLISNLMEGEKESIKQHNSQTYQLFFSCKLAKRNPI